VQDEQRALRQQEALRQVLRRDVRLSPGDTRLRDVVSAYETQKEQMSAELEVLRYVRSRTSFGITSLRNVCCCLLLIVSFLVYSARTT
jgi:hypothetical protein